MFRLFAPVMTLATTLAEEPQVFVWTENLGKVITTALLSMVPTFEGRYALVAAQAMGMPVLFSFLLAFVFSSLPMPFIFLLLRPVLRWFYSLPWKPIQRFAAFIENKASKGVKKLGNASFIALFLFVAIPLPGTGVWTGTMVATVLEMDRKKASVMILVGNLVACTIMTLATMGVFHLFGL